MKKIQIFYVSASVVLIFLAIGCNIWQEVYDFCVKIFSNRYMLSGLLGASGISFAVNYIDSTSIVIPRNGTENEQKMAAAQKVKEMGFDVKLPIK